MLCFAHSLLNISKKSYRICICVDIKTELHLFFYCNFHDALCMILRNKVCNILADNELAKHLDCLSNVEFLCLFLFGLSDAPIQILVAVFCAVDEFLKLCGRF